MPSTYVYGRGRNNSRNRYACHDKQAIYDSIMSNESPRQAVSAAPTPKAEPVVSTQATETPVEVVYVEKPLFTLENLIKFSFWKNFLGF